MWLNLRQQSFGALVLLVLNLWFLRGCYGSLLVFPSLTNTTGFAHIARDNTFVPIPSALEYLRCSWDEEYEDLKPMDNSCTNVLFFVSNSLITLQFFNLSSNGVLQPFTKLPEGQTTYMDGTKVEWKTEIGSTNLSRASANKLSTTAKLLSKDEENNAYLVEDSDDTNLHKNPNADIDDHVREANATSGFLDSTGAIVKGSKFVLEMELSNVTERRRRFFEFDFGPDGHVYFLVYFDSSPVSADIPQPSKGWETEDQQRYSCMIRFSTRMLNKPDPRLLSCPGVTGPLDELILAQRENALTPDHPLAMRTTVAKFPSCRNEIEVVDTASRITVEGCQASVGYMSPYFMISEIRELGTLRRPYVDVTLYVDKGTKVEVKLNINEEAGVSFSGAPVIDRTEVFHLGESTVQPAEPPAVAGTLGDSPPAAKSSDSESTAKLLGQITSSMFGASVGIAFVINVGTPFLVFVDPIRASGAMKSTGSLSSSVVLLQAAQTMYLMTKIAAPNLPKNFKAFGEQFYWTLLDFRAPWDKKSDSNIQSETPESDRRRLLGNETTTEDSDEVDDADPYDQLEDTYFWLLISILSLCFLHWFLVAIFFHYNNTVPSILRFPRLELYLIQSSVAIIATGPAYLFTGNTAQIIVGVVILAAGIFPLFALHFYVLRKYVLKTSEEEEKEIEYSLNYVKFSDDQSNADGLPFQRSSSSEQKPKENIQNEGDQSWFSKYVFSFLFGPLYRGGRWTTRKDNSEIVVHRVGPIFEDYRGIPMHEVTGESIPEEDLVDGDESTKVFELVEQEHRYGIDVPHYAYLMRVNEHFLRILKMVVITIVILGEDEAENNGQATVLFCIHLVYIVYLRVFRPPCKRRKLAVLMTEEALETIVVLLVICKLNTDHSKSREDIGTAMVVLQGIVMALLLLDVLLTTRPLVQEAIKVFWKRRSDETPSNRPGRGSSSSTTGFEELIVGSIRSAVSQRVVQPISNSLRSSARRRTSNRVSLLDNQTN